MKENSSSQMLTRDAGGRRKHMFLNASTEQSRESSQTTAYGKKPVATKSCEPYEASSGVQTDKTAVAMKGRTKLMAPPRGAKAARQQPITSNMSQGRSQHAQANNPSTCMMQQRTSSGNTSGRVRGSEDENAILKKRITPNAIAPSSNQNQQLSGLSSLIQQKQLLSGATSMQHLIRRNPQSRNNPMGSGTQEGSQTRGLTNSGNKKKQMTNGVISGLRDMNDSMANTLLSTSTAVQNQQQNLMNSGASHSSQQIIRKNLVIKSEKRGSKNSRTSLNRDGHYNYSGSRNQLLQVSHANTTGVGSSNFLAPPLLQTTTAMSTGTSKIQICGDGVSSAKSSQHTTSLQRIPQTVSTCKTQKNGRNVAAAQALHKESGSQSPPPHFQSLLTNSSANQNDHAKSSQQVLIYRGSQQPTQNATRNLKKAVIGVNSKKIKHNFKADLTNDNLKFALSGESHDIELPGNLSYERASTSALASVNPVKNNLINSHGGSVQQLMLMSQAEQRLLTASAGTASEGSINGSIPVGLNGSMSKMQQNCTIEYQQQKTNGQKYNFYPRMASSKANNTTIQSHISNSFVGAGLGDESLMSLKSREEGSTSDFNHQLNKKNCLVNLPAGPSSGKTKDKISEMTHPLMKQTIGSSPSPPPLNSGSKLFTSQQTASTQQLIAKSFSPPVKNTQPKLQPTLQVGLPTSPQYALLNTQAELVTTPQQNIKRQALLSSTNSSKQAQVPLIHKSHEKIPTQVNSVNRARNSKRTLKQRTEKEQEHATMSVTSPPTGKGQQKKNKRSVTRKNESSPQKQSNTSLQGTQQTTVVRKEQPVVTAAVNLAKKSANNSLENSNVQRKQQRITSTESSTTDPIMSSAEKLVIDKKTYQELMNQLSKLENQKRINALRQSENIGSNSNPMNFPKQSSIATASTGGLASKFGSVIGTAGHSSKSNQQPSVSSQNTRIKLQQQNPNTKSQLNTRASTSLKQHTTVNRTKLTPGVQDNKAQPTKLHIIKKQQPVYPAQILNPNSSLIKKTVSQHTLAQKFLQRKSSKPSVQNSAQRSKYLAVPEASKKAQNSISPVLKVVTQGKPMQSRNVVIAKTSNTVANESIKNQIVVQKNSSQELETQPNDTKNKQEVSKKRHIQSARSSRMTNMDPDDDEKQLSYKDQRKSRGNFNTFGEQLVEPTQKQLNDKPNIPASQQQYNSLESDFEEGQSAVRLNHATEISDYKDNVKVVNETQQESQAPDRNQEFHYSGSFGLPAGQNSNLIENMHESMQQVTFDDMQSYNDQIRKADSNQNGQVIDNLSKLILKDKQQQEEQKYGLIRGPEDNLLTSSATSMAQAVEKYFEQGEVMQSSKDPSSHESLQKRLSDQQKFQFVNDLNQRQVVQSPDFASADQNQYPQTREGVTNVNAMKLLNIINKNLGRQDQQPMEELLEESKTGVQHNITDQSIDEKLCNVSGGILETNTVIENECDNEFRYLMLTNQQSAQATSTERSLNTATQQNTFQSEHNFINQEADSSQQFKASQPMVSAFNLGGIEQAVLNSAVEVGDKLSDMHSLLVSRSSFDNESKNEGSNTSPAQFSSAIRSKRNSLHNLNQSGKKNQPSQKPKISPQFRNLHKAQSPVSTTPPQESSYYQTMRTTSDYNAGAPSNTSSRGHNTHQKDMSPEHLRNTDSSMKQKQFGLDLYGGDETDPTLILQQQLESSESEDIIDKEVQQYVSINKEEQSEPTHAQSGDHDAEFEEENDKFDFVANLNKQFIGALEQRRDMRQLFMQQRKKSI